MSGPFQDGTKQQGQQSSVTPAAALSQGAGGARRSIAAPSSGNRAFADLRDAQKDEVITGLEDGSLKLDGVDSQAASSSSSSRTPSRAFSPIPIYGGNRDMAAGR